MLVDVKGAAKALGGVGESTLRRWIAQGKLPVVRLGRRVLIRREALDEMIERAEGGRAKPHQQESGGDGTSSPGSSQRFETAGGAAR